jgi:hypothetical protein
MGKSSFLQASFPKVLVKKKGMQPCDLDFLFNRSLLDAITLEAECPVLNAMTPMHIRRGWKSLISSIKGGGPLAVFTLQILQAFWETKMSLSKRNGKGLSHSTTVRLSSVA